MSRKIFQGGFKDGNGSAVADGTVTVYLAGTTTLATIYSTEVIVAAISGSTLTTGSDGGWLFWVDSSDYGDSQKFKVILSKAGYESKTYDNIVIPSATAEGTWTPVIYGSTSAGLGTYTTQVGRYTKIGRLVFVEAKLVISAHTGTGNFLISGLPYDCNSIHNARFSVIDRADLVITAGHYLVPVLSKGTSVITLMEAATGEDTSAVLAIDVACTLEFSGFYTV
jgi:hypothetical protein